MLAPAVRFVQVILALHIVFAVIAFGVVFAYPLLLGLGARVDPVATPTLHRLQVTIGRWLLSPGLVAVVVFGVILAARYHVWKAFYVQWGIGAVLVIGAIEGAFLIPRSRRLAELAARDLAATAGARVSDGANRGIDWSPDYRSLRRQLALGAAAIAAIVVVTIYLMAIQAS